MSAKPRYKSYNEFLEEVKNEFREYENQRLFCLSFRDRFNSGNDRVYTEPKISPTDKSDDKDPDLLLNLSHKDWAIIDYKEITSDDPVTLEAHMADITKKYNQEFNFEKKIKFEPSDIVLACPPIAAEAIGKSHSVNAIPCLSVTMDDPIKINAARSGFKSKLLEKLFESETTFAQTSETSTQKFLRHKPKCKSYIAANVALFILQVPNSFVRNEIRVQRDKIAKIMTNYYPPYLRSSKEDRDYVMQITEGRLDIALEFLRKIDFIDIELEEINGKPVEVIVGSMEKGRKGIVELTEYLIGKEAKQRFQDQEKKRKEEEREARKQKRKEERELKKKLEREEKKRQKEAMKSKGIQTLEQWFDKRPTTHR